MGGYVLGIDLGTSGTKTVLFDLEGRTVASALAEYPLSQPRPLWAEQDPEDWWRAACQTIQAVLAQSGVKPGEIQGVGLSGQMHGVVLLDDQNRVLRPALLWCDQRSGQQCAWIEEKVGRERLMELACNPALTGFSAPKLLWVRDQEPEVFARIARVLLPKDYLRFRLTGVFATEVSDASGTLFLNVRERNWSHELMHKLGVNPDWFPPVYESPVVSATVSREGAAATGLVAGTPVVGGGGDQAAGAVGNGIVAPGVLSSTIGTSGVVFAYSEEVKVDPQGRVHTFCHALPGKWHVMGVTQAAGLSFRWFRDNFGAEERELAAWLGKDPYELLSAEAERAVAGSEGLLYLPYLMGERTPHLDPDAKGCFFGLTGRHDRAAVIRAVMEGVVYSLRDSLEILRELGVPVSEIRASGGGARSPLWRTMQADIFNSEVVTINATEGPALGAAILAAVGSGAYTSVPEACAHIIKTQNRTRPVPERVALYNRYYGIYRRLYGALKEFGPELSRLNAEVLATVRG